MIPDARARKTKSIKVRGREFQQVYCSNCGCNGGHVRAEFVLYVFYICEDCSEKYGRISAPELAEDIVRGR